MTWQIGDDPAGHPLWEQQIALEWEMQDRGAARYKAALAKARNKEDMGKIGPFRRLTEVLVGDMMIGLKGWLTSLARKRGAPPMAYQYIKGMDMGVVSYICIRTTLDSYAGGMAHRRFNGYLQLAATIGLEVEYQARMEAWLKDEPGLYMDIQKVLKQQRATTEHRKRVNINRFNHLVSDKVAWVDWGSDVRKHVGFKLIDIMCRATGRFAIVSDPSFIQKSKKVAPYVVEPHEEIVKYLSDAVESEAARQTVYLPTLIPPKPWEGIKDGGYYTKVLHKPRLIRFHAYSEEAQGIAAEEFDSLDMPRVYSALSAVQNVAWRINKRVLGVAWDCWGREIYVKGLGRQLPAPMPPRPAELEALHHKAQRRKLEAAWIKKNPKLFKAWKQAAAKIHGENARRIAHVMAARTTLQIADKFANNEFYFPHMLDFRGRMYPVPSYLSPQGGDLARGLLTFSNARPLGKHGGYWLAVNVANTWGNDKVSFEERKEWALSNYAKWARIVADPMKDLEWTQASSPWQFLAAIMEFVRAVEGDMEHTISALPIRVDGTCNGIQHLSAMMRDAVGGASVNLLPAERPRDIYKEVADDLALSLGGIEESGGINGTMADIWMSGFKGNIPRSFTKRQVMVMPYGGTREAYFKYTRMYLEQDDPTIIPDTAPIPDTMRRSKKGARFNEEGEEELLAKTTVASTWLVPHLWDAVARNVGQGMVCMAWLKACAKVLAETGQPITWQTPSGFHVRHFYGTLQESRIKTLVDGKQIKITEYNRTRKLSTAEQLQGIAPNFVHSMDGCANMETAIRFNVISSAAPFTTIHDSFGTVPGEMDRLMETLRYSFVWVHKVDVLDGFRNKCVGIYRDYLIAMHPGNTFDECWQMADEIIPPVPDRGDLDIEQVLKADYFFA